MSPQTSENSVGSPKLAYGELPPHPFEAKKLHETPEGWEKIQVVFDRELFEPLGSTTRAAQLDEAVGPEGWGIVPHQDEDGEVNDRMFDVVARGAESDEAESSEA